MGFPRQEYWVGCCALLQGIFLTQESNPGLPHRGWILYYLSCQASPRILQRVAYLFFRVSSWPRNQTRVSCIAGKFFTSWATREALSWEMLTEILHYQLTSRKLCLFMLPLKTNSVQPSEIYKKKIHLISTLLTSQRIPLFHRAQLG